MINNIIKVRVLNFQDRQHVKHKRECVRKLNTMTSNILCYQMDWNETSNIRLYISFHLLKTFLKLYGMNIYRLLNFNWTS